MLLPDRFNPSRATRVTGWQNEATDYAFPLEAVTFNGEMMSVPWETRVWVLWYRQDVLEEMGLEVPTTLDELAEVGGAIMEGSGGSTTGLGIGLSEGSLGADFMEKFEPLLWAYGGQLLDDDGNAGLRRARRCPGHAVDVRCGQHLRRDGSWRAGNGRRRSPLWFPCWLGCHDCAGQHARCFRT